MNVILIAEDDPTSAKVLRKAIESLNYIPIVASNGKRALEILMDNPSISLLVSDVMMPEMSGTDLVKTLKGHQTFRDLPIILVSAVVDYADLKELLTSDASFFIKKPVDIDQLKKYIQESFRYSSKEASAQG